MSDEATEEELLGQCCPNCGVAGHPLHHWMRDANYEGYVCFTPAEEEAFAARSRRIIADADRPSE